MRSGGTGLNAWRVEMCLPSVLRELAPKIYGEDLTEGLLILEDLGSEPVVDGGTPRPERYAEAVRVLAKLHANPLPPVLPVAEGTEHRLPPYDMEALLFEAELMPEWYAPAIRNVSLSAEARAAFVDLWRAALQGAIPDRPTWTLRDYHSPNLIWLPEREGAARVGMIDFQDAVRAHPSWDLHSLLQDARRDVSPALEAEALDRYFALRPQVDRAAFMADYAGLAALNEAPIIGIFARLIARDGKPRYRQFLPRMWRHLNANLDQPALAPVARWFDRHVPVEVRA